MVSDAGAAISVAKDFVQGSLAENLSAHRQIGRQHDEHGNTPAQRIADQKGGEGVPHGEHEIHPQDPHAADTDEGGAFDKDTGVLFAELEKIDPDMNKVASIAHRRKVRYVVLSNGIWPKIPITKLGYETFYETPSCTVYREVAGQ